MSGTTRHENDFAPFEFREWKGLEKSVMVTHEKKNGELYNVMRLHMNLSVFLFSYIGEMNSTLDFMKENKRTRAGSRNKSYGTTGGKA